MSPTRSAPPKWTTTDLVAMASLGPLSTTYVAWTAWSIRPGALVSVLNEIVVRGRRQVVELGAGTSTIFLARLLREHGGSLVSIEHDQDWATYVRRSLNREQLDSIATVETVDLAPFESHSTTHQGDWSGPREWYDVDRLLSICPSDIDMLLVDGPPAGEHRDMLVREPAVTALQAQLATAYSIALDDVDRPAELATVRRWEAQLSIEITVIERLALAIGRSDGGFVPSL